jgi:hypothetical protein
VVFLEEFAVFASADHRELRMSLKVPARAIDGGGARRGTPVPFLSVCANARAYAAASSELLFLRLFPIVRDVEFEINEQDRIIVSVSSSLLCFRIDRYYI